MSEFRYIHFDGRESEGSTTWYAIRNAIGRADSDALPELMNLHWATSVGALSDGREVNRSSVVETREGFIGVMYELRE